MTVWLLKENVLQDDITNKTIYKTWLIKKLTIAMRLQKISRELCGVHNGNPKSNYFNNFHKNCKVYNYYIVIYFFYIYT